jgi:hypothetical protein
MLSQMSLFGDLIGPADSLALHILRSLVARQPKSNPVRKW